MHLYIDINTSYVYTYRIDHYTITVKLYIVKRGKINCK
jgi:hypothetical protein